MIVIDIEKAQHIFSLGTHSVGLWALRMNFTFKLLQEMLSTQQQDSFLFILPLLLCRAVQLIDVYFPGC